MKRWCDAHGAALALVVVPTRAQVYPELWDEERRRFGLRAEDFDLDRPQALLRALAEDEGLVAVDLLPALRASREGDRLYHGTDIHWTARGHAVAAAEILRALRASGLAPAQ
jgi:hypothetical protein